MAFDMNGTIKETVKHVPGMVALIVVVIVFLRFMSAQAAYDAKSQAEEHMETMKVYDRIGEVIDRNTTQLGRVEKTLDRIAGD